MAKWLKVAGLAAVALLMAVSASGDSNTYNYQGSGPYFNTKNGAIVDVSGNAKVVDADRDRDFSTSALSVMSATSLLAGTTRGSVTALSVASYSRMGLMLRWTTTAAADSDSVNIVVKVFAKKSSTMDDGMNHLWARLGSGAVSDTANLVQTTGVSVTGNVFATYYITRNRTTGLKLHGSAQGYVYTIPVRLWRWAGNGGIYIPLEDNGVPFNAQYVGFEFTNANITKDLLTFTADLWPKVN